MGGGEWSLVRQRCGARLPDGNGQGGVVDIGDPILTLTEDGEVAESSDDDVGWWRLNGARRLGGLSVEGGIWQRE
jgi:hypothetical protein